MILENEFGKPMSRVARMALVAIAIGVLPMAARVAWAQNNVAPDPSAEATPSGAPKNDENRIRVPTDPTQEDKDRANPESFPAPDQQPTQDASDAPGPTSSTSLEQRVDRIETLLNRLIEARERASEVVPKNWTSG